MRVKYETQDGDVKQYHIKPVAYFITKGGKEMLSVEKLPDDGSAPTQEGLAANRRTFHLSNIKEVEGVRIDSIQVAQNLPYGEVPLQPTVTEPIQHRLYVFAMADGQLLSMQWTGKPIAEQPMQDWRPAAYPQPKPAETPAENG